MNRIVILCLFIFTVGIISAQENRSFAETIAVLKEQKIINDDEVKSINELVYKLKADRGEVEKKKSELSEDELKASLKKLNDAFNKTLKEFLGDEKFKQWTKFRKK